MNKSCVNTNVVRNPKTKFRSPPSDIIFKAKSLAHRTLQHICKAHKTYRTKPTLQKSCNRRHTINSQYLDTKSHRLAQTKHLENLFSQMQISYPNLFRYSLGVTPNIFFTYLVKNDRLENAISSAISAMFKCLFCKSTMSRSLV